MRTLWRDGGYRAFITVWWRGEKGRGETGRGIGKIRKIIRQENRSVSQKVNG